MRLPQRIGCYQVTAKIGEGGMREVYQARDTKLDRDVALKVLPEAFTADPDRLARFEREAKVLASLNHPNIGTIYGLEEAEGGRFKALVLELVEGPTLADRIKQGPIPLDEALPIAMQIAEALEAAHEQGVIHRDLKPANVKVKDDGTVKVLDFGLAKAFQPETSGPDVSMSPTISLTAAATQMGMVIGTAAYMAPEQAKGKAVDRRADIWAFGAVLYEMLVGTRAFAGGDVSETLAFVITRDVDWDALPEATPPAVRHVLRRCLERDPKRRLRDVGDARLDLEDRTASPTTGQTAAVAAPRAPLWPRPAILIAAGLVSAIVGGLVVWTLSHPADSPVARALITAPAARPLNLASDTNIAISPDGSRVVFRATADGETSLFVRRMAEFEATPLAGLGGNPRGPFVSPDGVWIAFFAQGTLRKVNMNGGPPITIGVSPGGVPRGASWGPDDTIVFATTAGSGLWQMPAGGGEPEPLTTPDPERGELDHMFPTFLPGGDAALFSIITVGGSFDEAQTAILSLDTGRYEVLFPGGTSPKYVSSGHIVYMAAGTLFAVGFDVERREVTSDPIPVVDTVRRSGQSGAADFAVSDDGTLVYVRGGGDGELMALTWVDRDGIEEPLPLAPGRYGGLRFSPDGTRLALETSGDEGVELVVYDFERDTLSQLTFSPGGNCCPVWSPDGARIVFTSSRDGVPDLYHRNADGTGSVERAVAGGPPGRISWDWSADGTTVIFSGSGNLRALGMGAEPTDMALVDTPFAQVQAALSPDGRWLAYQSNEDGDFDIYVRPFPNVDSGLWKVSAAGGQFPLWSADGSELFFVAGDAVMASAITAGATFDWATPVALFSGSYALVGDRSIRVFDVSPDGRFLLRKAAAASDGDVGAPELVAVFNWFEELKKLVPVP